MIVVIDRSLLLHYYYLDQYCKFIQLPTQFHHFPCSTSFIMICRFKNGYCCVHGLLEFLCSL